MTKAPSLKQHRLSNNLNSKHVSPIVSSSTSVALNNTTVRQSRNFKLPISNSTMTNKHASGTKSNQMLINATNSPNLNHLASKRDSNNNLITTQ